MGRGILWDGDAWEDYCDWQKIDKAAAKRINAPSAVVMAPAPENDKHIIHQLIR